MRYRILVTATLNGKTKTLENPKETIDLEDLKDIITAVHMTSKLHPELEFDITCVTEIDGKKVNKNAN